MPPDSQASDSNAVTRLLREWRDGDAGAEARLMPIVYDRMRELADSYMKRERADHTLQATALVHEAYVRLVNVDIDWQDRVHFYVVAARTMRRILVEHARGKNRQRRGGGWQRETWDDAVAITPGPNIDMLALDEALSKLEAQDERKSQVIELHYFGGLSYDEIATALEISPATVDRDLRMAKAWLHRTLTE